MIEPPRARGRWGAVATAGIAIVLGLGLVSRRSGPVDYETVPLTSGSLTQRVTAVGQLEPVDKVVVGSDLTGEILEVRVDVNQRVIEGEVLARLDPEPFDNAVAQARAGVSSSRANVAKGAVELERATAELARTERLLARGAATPVQASEAALNVRAARAALDGFRASRDQARASLVRAEQDRRDTEIVSPIEGVVVRRHVDDGQTVVSAMSATPLFEVASDLTALKAVVEVDEADVGLVGAGQLADFTVAAFPDRTFTAVVRTVDLSADPRSAVVVYGTELRVDNRDRKLRPGMTATAEIHVGEVLDAWLAPTRALRFRPEDGAALSGDHVWTLQDGALSAVPVRVAGADGATTAIYGEALSEGLAVVIGGAP
ncbi:MAG: efflux RND transporter periplasmic adaptor subunit [Myxococcota bacterium]